MIIGLCGLKQHGKSTVAEFLRAEHGFKVFAFADALRQMLETLDPFIQTQTQAPHPQGGYIGFDVYKRYSQVLKDVGYEYAKTYPEVRRLLQVLGTECGRNILGEQVWVDAWLKTAGRCAWDTNIAVPDVRFENEVEAVRLLGGKIVRVSRPVVVENVDLHESERYANDLVVDYTIENKDTLDDLRLKTFAMLAKLDCSRS